jgi:hypothetical protein
MTNKLKKKVREHAEKHGMSYQAAHNRLVRKPEEPNEEPVAQRSQVDILDDHDPNLCFKCKPNFDQWNRDPNRPDAWLTKEGIGSVFFWEGKRVWIGKLQIGDQLPRWMEEFDSCEEAQSALVNERRRLAGCKKIDKHNAGTAQTPFVEDLPPGRSGIQVMPLKPMYQSLLWDLDPL